MACARRAATRRIQTHTVSRRSACTSSAKKKILARRAKAGAGSLARASKALHKVPACGQTMAVAVNRNRSTCRGLLAGAIERAGKR